MSEKDESPVQESLGEVSGMDGQPHLTTGMKLGRFVLLQAMGSGGMGSVFAAWDPHLGRRVAIKVLHPGSSSDGSKRARMLREARALAQLNHPNVVRVYELGETNEFPYLVMELVEGESLGQLVRHARLPQREILRHFVNAADGLRAVHELGIVHRDIKPTNIFVGKDGRVLIGDFGLAVPGERLSEDLLRAQDFEDSWQDEDSSVDKELSAISADEISLRMTLTRAGSLLGTPAFMAPEHLSGEQVDERSDQYSFAVSIWRGLFGCDPFPSAKSLVCRLDQMKEPPTRGDSASDECHVVPVLEKALEFSPERRYRNMAEFQDALQRCLTASMSPKSGLFATRHSTLGVAAGFVLAIALGSFGWVQISNDALKNCDADSRISSFRSSATQDALRRSMLRSAKFDEQKVKRVLAVLDSYAARWQSAAESLCRSPESTAPGVRTCLEARLGDFNAITSLIDSDLPEALPELHAGALSLAPPEGCFQEAYNARTDTLPSATGQEVRAQLARARALLLSGVYGEAGRIAKQAKEVASDAGARHEVAESSLVLGQALAGAGNYPEAAQTLRDAISAALTLRAERVEAAAWAALLSVVGDRQGNFEEGLRILPMVRAAAERVSYDRNIFASARLAEALLWKGLRNPTKAEHAAQEALDAAEKRVPADARQKGRILCIYGLILGDQGRIHEGIAEIQKAREVTISAMDETHMYIAVIDNNLGTLLMLAEEYEDAARVFSRTMRSLERQTEERRHIVAAPLNNLGKIARHQGNLELAQSYFTRAHQLLLATLGKQHRRTLIPQLALARIAQDRREFSKADLIFEEVIRLLQNVPEAQVQLEEARVEQAFLAMENGNVEQAEQLLERVSAFVAQHNDVKVLRARWALAQMTRFVLKAEWSQAKIHWTLANDAQEKLKDSALQEGLRIAELIFGRDHNSLADTPFNVDDCRGKRLYDPAVRLLGDACLRAIIE